MNVIKDPGLGRREGEEKNAHSEKARKRSKNFEASAIEM
jgi:hypothetical protein